LQRRHEAGIDLLQRGFALVLDHADDIALAHREDNADRIELHDARERAGVGPDYIAFGEVRAPDPAGDRRDDAGVAEIELGGAHAGLGGLDRGRRRIAIRGRLIEIGTRAGLPIVELLAPLQRQLRVAQRRLGARLLRFGLLQRGFILRRLDREQQIVGLDVLSFGERDLLEEALHARAHVDLLNGLDTPDELEVLRDVLEAHCHDRHGRRRPRGRLRVRANNARAGERDQSGGACGIDDHALSIAT
jgi:hypothetical protein